jgi:hypothetical protein
MAVGLEDGICQEGNEAGEGSRKSRIEMRSRNSEHSQKVIRSSSDREKRAADTITTNCQAEAVSQNAVEAEAWIRGEGQEISEEERIPVFPIPNAQNKDNDEPS